MLTIKWGTMYYIIIDYISTQHFVISSNITQFVELFMLFAMKICIFDVLHSFSPFSHLTFPSMVIYIKNQYSINKHYLCKLLDIFKYFTIYYDYYITCSFSSSKIFGIIKGTEVYNTKYF